MKKKVLNGAILLLCMCGCGKKTEKTEVTQAEISLKSKDSGYTWSCISDDSYIKQVSNSNKDDIYTFIYEAQKEEGMTSVVCNYEKDGESLNEVIYQFKLGKNKTLTNDGSTGSYIEENIPTPEIKKITK